MTIEDKMMISNAWTSLKSRLSSLDRDESGVAMTEYVIIFSLVSFGAMLALLSTAVYVKAYRDFMVWWLAHPAV